jgi:hypothetical protein
VVASDVAKVGDVREVFFDRLSKKCTQWEVALVTLGETYRVSFRDRSLLDVLRADAVVQVRVKVVRGSKYEYRLELLGAVPQSESGGFGLVGGGAKVPAQAGVSK